MPDAAAQGQGFESPTCPICLNELESAAEVARPSVCDHLHCRSCLETLCREDPSLRRCPLDMKPFERICVRRQTETAETVLMADTLSPPQMLLPSHAVAIGLGFYLLALLWLSPSWLLAVHIAAVGGIYCYTGGEQNSQFYGIYSLALYALFVPCKFFGFFMSGYACCCCALIMYWCQQIPAMQASGHWRQDRVLLGGTCVVICVIYPALIFSLYELTRIYCYALCLVLVSTLHTYIFEAFARYSHLLSHQYARYGLLLSHQYARYGLLLSHQYARYAHLLSILVMAPSLCWLPELTLPHLIYNCLVAGFLAFSYGPHAAANNLQQILFVFNTNHVKTACQIVVFYLLGFSVWPAVYSIMVIDYCKYLLHASLETPQKGRYLPLPVADISQSFQSLFTRLPSVLAVKFITVLILMPCQIFGLFIYVGSFLLNRLLSCVMYFLLFTYLPTRPNSATIGIVIQLTVLGILVPFVFFTNIF